VRLAQRDHLFEKIEIVIINRPNFKPFHKGKGLGSRDTGCCPDSKIKIVLSGLRAGINPISAKIRIL
jgi:hypothetical protein